MEELEKNWEEILKRVKEEQDLTDVSFYTWIRPLKVYAVQDGCAYILWDSEQLGLSYLTKKYYQPLKVAIAEVTGTEYDIEFILPKDISVENSGPGKEAVETETPNKENVTVAFSDLVESREFQSYAFKTAFCVGKDVDGNVVVADIAEMPHLLIAGSLDTDRHVCINTIIMSILLKANPVDVKLIMIDSEVEELSVYSSIPHLQWPIVTDPKKAVEVLQWTVAEVTDRYHKFAETGVRDINGYNKKAESAKDNDDENTSQKMSRIVVIIDELADLMMAASEEVEEVICRLAQTARATGVHLIIATQHPSVNVITEPIKANIPSRIAFAVTSEVDSETILDINGAENLLGKGDMLFFPQGFAKPIRVQGPLVSDTEVSNVVDNILMKNGQISFNPDIYKFFNSKDMADYLKDINYEFSLPEAAFIVYQSEHRTLGEKFEAWQELINTMPDCSIEGRPRLEPMESVHQFLRDYMELQKKILRIFRESDGYIYTYAFYNSPYYWGSMYFADADAAFADFEQGKEDYLADGEQQVRFVRLPVHRQADPERMETIWLDMTMDLEVISMEASSPLLSEKEDALFQKFDMMFFPLPAPFKRGDIVIDRSCYPDKEGPFVLDTISTWDKETLLKNGFSPQHSRVTSHEKGFKFLLEYGDSSDMSYAACYLDKECEGFPQLYHGNGWTYLNLERYKEPLRGLDRVLKAVSSAMTYDPEYDGPSIEPELLCNAYQLIVCEEMCKVNRECLEGCYPEDWKERAGLK